MVDRLVARSRLEIGPEFNRHSKAHRYSGEWMTMGLSDKNRDLDFQSDIDSRWPFEDDSLDIVFGSHVMEHARDPIHFIGEAFRVLRPGGVCRMNVPDAMWLCRRYVTEKTDLYHVIRNLRSWHGAPAHKAHWHPYDEETITFLFKHGWYPVLGAARKPDTSRTLFDSVACVRAGESRVPELEARYFNTRADRSVFCEGTKP